MDQSFELVVAFDRDDPAFARGVEIGMLHQRLTAEPLPVVAYVHRDNFEMALRLAEARGASARAEPGDGDWLPVVFA